MNCSAPRKHNTVGSLNDTDIRDLSAYRAFMCARTLYGTREFERGFKYLLHSARLGYVCAHEWLGAAYDYGLGTRPNRRLALKHYKSAAEAGNANAQYHLGVFYRDGIGTRRNLRLAMKWILKAYAQGDEGAAHLLGECCLHGIGVTQNSKRGFKLEFEAAQRGLVEAQYVVGVCYGRAPELLPTRERGLHGCFVRGTGEAEMLVIDSWSYTEKGSVPEEIRFARISGAKDPNTF